MEATDNRYFFVSFRFQTKNKQTGYGDGVFRSSNGKFVNRKKFTEEIKALNSDIESVNILSILEISQEDFIWFGL